MELTFGFCFGLTLGYAAWLKRGAILSAQANPPPAMVRLPAIGWSVAATAIMVLVALWLDANIEMVWAYTFVGVGLLIIALFSEQLAWQVALIVTYSAFALDLTDYFNQQQKLTDPFCRGIWWAPRRWCSASWLRAGNKVESRWWDGRSSA